MFGSHPILVFGTEIQRKEWLSRLVQGLDKLSFGEIEPDAGLDTTSFKTFAQKVDGGYVVNGQKIWNTTAQVADKIILVVRTTKREDVIKSTDGILMFYSDFNRTKIEVKLIEKMGRKCVDSNMIFFANLKCQGRSWKLF